MTDPDPDPDPDADPLRPATLLSLSDSVRASLRQHGTLGPDSARLSAWLRLALSQELVVSAPHRIDLHTVRAARLDRLVADLTRHDLLKGTGGEEQKGEGGRGTGSCTDEAAPPLLRNVAVAAGKLERLWWARFGAQYFAVDEMRAAELRARWGRVVRGRQAGLRGSGSWFEAETAGGHGDEVGFEPGQWWPDMTCAVVDGLVWTEQERPGRGRDKVLTIPLLTGKEISTGVDKVRYFREGPLLSDVHPALISQTGKPVRVLRGSGLRSEFAPTVGVRNDGLWKIVRYGHALDEGTRKYRLELDLEQVGGQMPIAELVEIPRSSHLDDWDLYRRVKSSEGGGVVIFATRNG
ncbi:hypothetical protein VTK26DRAFT_1111 [Humicola hyalothermophila]